MSISAIINVRDSVTPALEAIAAGLGDIAGLHKSIGTTCFELVRNHLARISKTRHATAQKLGASPSHFWGLALKNTHMTSDAQAARISIESPGIGRATHDVRIVPTSGKKWLTIPIDKSGYNHRAYRMQDLVFIRPRGKSFALLGRREQDFRSRGSQNNSFKWIYLLVKSVHQKQDPTLVPTEKEFGIAAKTGALLYVKQLRLEARKARAAK